MKNILFFLVVILVFFSCSKQSELSKNFDCGKVDLGNTSSTYDFNKNFKIAIPSNWKTDLYYDNFQSEIFTADTTKQLTSTYILDTSFNLGELNFNEAYFKKNDSILAIPNLQKIKSGLIKFQSKPAYWYVAKGKKNNFDYHQFNISVKLSENTYFNAYSEIYGTTLIDERICESIAIIETVEFLQ